jgi:hypothetical protein
MKNTKNYLIAFLIGLLVLTVSIQNSNGASTPTTIKLTKADLIQIANATPYVTIEEQAKLAEYTFCLTQWPRVYTSIDVSRDMAKCAAYRP